MIPARQYFLKLSLSTKKQSNKVKSGGRRILNTSNLAVVGSPIDHSKSPALHAAAYDALGLDWLYTKHDVSSGGLVSFVRSCNESWRGLSVTMPLKREAFELAASHDAHAELSGAVNTLAFSYEQGRRVIRGYNTDVFGIHQSVSAAGAVGIDHAVIIGGGATAESALLALDNLGVGYVTVVLRSPEKAGLLKQLGHRIGLDVRVHALDSLAQVSTSQVVISTVPGSAKLSLEPLQRSSGAILLDAAYDVWPSPRALAWQAAGGVAVSGLSMLAYQAIKQVRIFVADAPDVPLAREKEVAATMFASVGLNEIGL